MKKLLLLTAFALGAVIYVLNGSSGILKAETPVKKSTSPVTFHKTVELVKQENVIEKSLKVSPTVDALEDEFKDLNIKNIQAKLAMTEAHLNQGRFIQKANSPEGLAPEEVQAFVELIRTRQALNRILIERDLEDMERKYL